LDLVTQGVVIFPDFGPPQLHSPFHYYIPTAAWRRICALLVHWAGRGASSSRVRSGNCSAALFEKTRGAEKGKKVVWRGGWRRECWPAQPSSLVVFLDVRPVGRQFTLSAAVIGQADGSTARLFVLVIFPARTLICRYLPSPGSLLRLERVDRKEALLFTFLMISLFFRSLQLMRNHFRSFYRLGVAC